MRLNHGIRVMGHTLYEWEHKHNDPHMSLIGNDVTGPKRPHLVKFERFQMWNGGDYLVGQPLITTLNKSVIRK